MPGTDSFYDDLRQKLARCKENNLLRIRRHISTPQGPKVTIDGYEFINFSSNDYLGLANHPALIASLKQGLEQYGVGSGASPLMCGRSEPHARLEQKLAKKTGRESALLFANGYLANIAVVTTLAGRHDQIFLDRLAHASLIDAAKLSGAKLKRYAHAESESLRSMLLSADDNKKLKKLVVTDGVFSMDGDQAPLADLAKHCAESGAFLIVDDAHGFGVLGETGGGILEASGLDPKEVPVLIATFGKALGVAGAFVAADKTIIETLVQQARSYIYTTAPPPVLALAAMAALKLIEAEPWRRHHLAKLIRRLRNGAQHQGIHLARSETPIQPLIIGEPEQAMRVSQALFNQGFLIPAIRPPTVPVHSARLRISLTAAHTEAQIDQLLEALSKALSELCQK